MLKETKSEETKGFLSHFYHRWHPLVLKSRSFKTGFWWRGNPAIKLPWSFPCLFHKFSLLRPREQAQMLTKVNYWGDAVVDHSQIIGGWCSRIIRADISPHPTGFRHPWMRTVYQRWSPRRQFLKSLALASKVKSLALASKPQVLENCPVLGSMTALFFEQLKFCWKMPETLRKICEHLFCFPYLEHRCSQGGVGSTGPDPPSNWNFTNDKNVTKKPIVFSVSV